MLSVKHYFMILCFRSYYVYESFTRARGKSVPPKRQTADQPSAVLLVPLQSLSPAAALLIHHQQCNVD